MSRREGGGWIGSADCMDALEYYKQGHTVKETAEKFHTTKAQINNATKKYRVTNGFSFGDRANVGKQANAESRIAGILLAKGLLYVGGYTTKNGSVDIQCKKCGTIFKRTVAAIYECPTVCLECKKAETEKRNQRKKMLARQEAELRKIENKWLKAIYPPKDERKEALLDRVGTCEICGKKYTVRDYTQSAGLKYAVDNGVCSKECKDEKTRRIKRKYKTPSNHLHRARKYGVPYETGITLKKLVKRDGLRCSICGCMCDWNDHEWSRYSGPTHPTIDHIVPLAKGGSHTWDNIQVACAMCNSLKSDKMEGLYE